MGAGRNLGFSSILVRDGRALYSCDSDERLPQKHHRMHQQWCMRAATRAHARTHTHTHTHTRQRETDRHAHTRRHTHTHARTHTRTHSHAHTHRRERERDRQDGTVRIHDESLIAAPTFLQSDPLHSYVHLPNWKVEHSVCKSASQRIKGAVGFSHALGLAIHVDSTEPTCVLCCQPNPKAKTELREREKFALK
jgi:hypothetical protein